MTELVPIIVASTVDRNFLPMIEVVATSIAATARNGRAVEYHVLYMGPASRISRRLQGWQRGAVTIHLHPFVNPWERFGRVSGLPPSTLSRFSLPDVLADKSRAIYLDTDVIVEADLGELYDAPLDDMPVGAVIDRHVVEQALKPVAGTERHRAELLAYLSDFLGLETEEQVRDYRQAGVLLMNLDALRAMNFATQMGRVLELKARGLRYADQCAINHLLSGRMALLDPRWNVLAYSMVPEKSASILAGFETYTALQQSRPFIIHFAGPKPWLSRRMPGAALWWQRVRDAGRGRQFYLLFLRERLNHRLVNLRKRKPAPTHQTVQKN